MTIRRLALMGVLMIASVVFTLVQINVLKDPPGVTTRWFDGTTEKVETFHQNGKPATITTYGDDGKSIITYDEWDRSGQLVNTKRRLPDGKVESKTFQRGKQLQSYVLYSGDMSYTLIERQYDRYGILSSEKIKTEDGTVVRENRRFHSNGKLAFEHVILENADQKIGTYDYDGKPQTIQLIRGNGSLRVEDYHPNGQIESIAEVYNNFGNGFLEVKKFTDKGVLTNHLNRPGDGSETLSVYEGGKLKFKQKFTVLDSGLTAIQAVELYEDGSEIPTREVKKNPKGGIDVHIFDDQGKLRSVKHVKDSVVVEQFDYSEEGGKPQSVEPTALKPIEQRALNDQGTNLRERVGVR